MIVQEISRIWYTPVAYVSDLCKYAARPLNAIRRLKSHLTLEARKILIQSFVYFVNFIYCPLVWNFKSLKAIHKIETLQKRPPRLLFDDFKSSYEILLMKAKKPKLTAR